MLTESELAQATLRLDARLRDRSRNTDLPEPFFGYGDQFEAARSELFSRLGNPEGSTAVLPDGIRLSHARTLVGWFTDTGETCPHRPNYLSPEPVFAAAWEPNLVVCLACKAMLDPTPDHCNLCGDQFEGENDAGFLISIIGTMAYGVSVCRTCEKETVNADQNGLRN